MGFSHRLHRFARLVSGQQHDLAIHEFHLVGAGGYNGFAGIISLYRELPVLFSVYKHTEFHLGRPAIIQQGIQGRFDGTAGEKHIIDEDDGLFLYSKGKVHDIRGHNVLSDIIPVKGNIQLTVLNSGIGLQCFDRVQQFVRHHHSALLYSNDDSIPEAGMGCRDPVRQFFYDIQYFLPVTDRLQVELIYETIKI